MDVHDYDFWLVKVGNEYLVAVAYEDTRMCRWSISPFDALRFVDVNDAIRIAQSAGGQIVKFNSITGRFGM